MQRNSEEVGRNIFRVLLAQLIFLAFWSLPAQQGPVLVYPPSFAADFYDFYYAAVDWLHGINPYVRVRFDKPPLVLWLGTAFTWMPFGAASYLFFALNLTIIVVSVRAFSRRFGLSDRSIDTMTGITFLFYPVYYLAERANLEGLVLGCVCWAFCTRNKILRAALIGIAGGLKLYPLLLIAPAVRNRQWRFVGGIVAVFALLLLPFYRLWSPFVHTMITRGVLYHPTENISPAGILVAIAGRRIGGWIYLAFWTGTLILMLHKHRKSTEALVMVAFLPWMVAFPMQVFPYGGVLLLPVLAWRLGEMKGRTPGRYDMLFVNGFLLVGVQAWAFTHFFSEIPISHPVFHLMNSLGMGLILGSLAMSPLKENETPPPLASLQHAI